MKDETTEKIAELEHDIDRLRETLRSLISWIGQSALGVLSTNEVRSLLNELEQ